MSAVVVIPRKCCVEYGTVYIPREMPLGAKTITEAMVTEVRFEGETYHYLDGSYMTAMNIRTGEIVQLLEESW